VFIFGLVFGLDLEAVVDIEAARGVYFGSSWSEGCDVVDGVGDGERLYEGGGGGSSGSGCEPRGDC